jgi:hypothetical protein
MAEHLSDRIEWRNNARSASAAEHPVHRLTTLDAVEVPSVHGTFASCA